MTKNTQQDTIDFVTFDPNEVKADGRKRQKSEAASDREAVKSRKIEDKATKKRGVFDNARRVALLEAYVAYTPDGVPYKERNNSWVKITEKVNAVDNDTDVAKQTTQNEFKRLMQEYGPVFDRKVQERASGINRYNTDVEAAARMAYEKWKEDLASNKEDRDQKLQEVEERETSALELQRKALEGARYHAKKNKGKEREVAIVTPSQPDEISSCATSPSSPAPCQGEVPMKEDPLKKFLETRETQHLELLQSLQQIHNGIMMILEELRKK